MTDTYQDSTLAFLGQTELLIILAMVIVFFGGRKLPELARAAGLSITQFKKGLKDEDSDAIDGPQPAGGDGGDGERP